MLCTCRSTSFNPRARGGRDCRGGSRTQHRKRFNPRARGGALPSCLHGLGRLGVSIHAPAEGATLQDIVRSYLEKFQSTRPRRARPSRRTTSPRTTSVSIHAPAEGATGYCHFPITRAPVSIHAPAEGATRGKLSDGAGALGFNPRARGGRDPGMSAQCPVAVGFNPRARGGRDTRLTADWLTHPGFNPRARGGRDMCRARGPMIFPPFQSTRPRRARHAHHRCRYPLPGFNPRARGGRDDPISLPAADLTRFQSTRPRRARPGLRNDTRTTSPFQSTRPRRARLEK